MTLGLTPLSETIGEEVTGFDASKPLTERDVEALRTALADRCVLVIRDQPLSGGDLVALGRAFGELEILPEPDKRNPDFPEIFDLTNVRADGEIVDFDEPQAVFLRGTERWHTDSSFRMVPCLATMLHAVEVPSSGSHTQFANMYAAYDALPASRRAELDQLDLVHSYEYSRANNPGRMEPMNDDERAKYPPVRHPLVRTHPSGRRSLFIGAHASHVDGMDIDEGRALLAEIHDFATQPRFVHTHTWEANDLVVWDNRCALHRILPYEIAKERRVMRRVTVAGDRPVE